MSTAWDRKRDKASLGVNPVVTPVEEHIDHDTARQIARQVLDSWATDARSKYLARTVVSLLTEHSAREREIANLRQGLEIIAGGFEHALSVAKIFLRDAALPATESAQPELGQSPPCGEIPPVSAEEAAHLGGQPAQSGLRFHPPGGAVRLPPEEDPRG